MADLLTMAEQLGMSGRGLRLELEELDQLQTLHFALGVGAFCHPREGQWQ